jgi:uncharacterized protein
MPRPASYGAILLACALCGAAAPSYRSSVDAWREHREEQLTAPDGWLAVAGLFWLKTGQNRCGSDPAGAIVLPRRAPKFAGAFDLHNGKVTFRAAPGADVRIDGHPAAEAGLAPGKDKIRIGDLTMFIIVRGPRYYVRLIDPQSEMRRHFAGLKWYPVRPEYRVLASFTPYAPPKRIPITNILGITEDEPSPGYLRFHLHGQIYRLDAVVEDDQLFIIFRDRTAGKTTYGAGRFLDADMPKNGEVVLDFNEAYNPPCAFTPFATCPLPPKQNRLPVSIEAGELNDGHRR